MQAVQAVLLTADLFGVVWQQLRAPPGPFARIGMIDRHSTASLRLVSRGMRDLVDSVVPQLSAVPRRKGTGMSLESCLPRFASSLRDLALQVELLDDPRDIRDLANVELPRLEKLSFQVSTVHGLAWHAWSMITCAARRTRPCS
jgi:hypothetical protein